MLVHCKPDLELVNQNSSFYFKCQNSCERYTTSIKINLNYIPILVVFVIYYGLNCGGEKEWPPKEAICPCYPQDGTESAFWPATNRDAPGKHPSLIPTLKRSRVAEQPITFIPETFAPEHGMEASQEDSDMEQTVLAKGAGESGSRVGGGWG